MPSAAPESKTRMPFAGLSHSHGTNVLHPVDLHIGESYETGHAAEASPAQRVPISPLPRIRAVHKKL